MKNQNKTIKILIVEDLPTDVELAVREIKKENIDFTYQVVDTEPEFKKALAGFIPDIIISDYSMPDFDGMKALKITRSEDSILPFIVLTGSMNEETAVACMKAGANDYVLKEKIKRLPFALLEALEKSKIKAEKEKIKKQLSESEEKYRSLIENSADAIYLLYNRKFEIINHSFQKMFEYTLEEVNHPSFDFINLVAPESRPFIEERLKKMQQGKDLDTHYEFTAITKNGEKKEVEASVSYIDFRGDKATQGIIRNISERKATERRLRLLSRAIQQNPIAIEISDANGNIEYINPAFEKITGYTADEIIGKNPRILKSGHHSIEFYHNLWETILSGKDWIGELKNKRKNGELYWEDAIISPIFNSKGIITHFVAVKEDITEKKKMVEDLIRAKEKAEESDRLKSAFLANVSHEIRTPMNGILGFANLLKKPKLSDDKLLNYIDIIEQSGKRMLDLINDLINISRIESGQLDFSYAEINLNAQLAFQYEFFKVEAERKGLDMSLDCPLPDNQAKIITDREKFDTIFSNLIKNAIKFTREGKISISYTPKEESIIFCVADTGIGIPKEKQSAVFERFVQAESHLSREYEGAGLGLSITKAYVEALGGKIWIESEKNKGTTICLTLPKKAQATIPNKHITNEQAQINSSDFKNYSILAAEDDEFNYLLIEELLLERGCTIQRARNGQEAIDLYKKDPAIKLILMDIKMPVIDGYEAAKVIKKDNPGIPIIAQSAYAMEHEIKKFREIFDDYITKPIKEDELMHKIKKWIK
ncbi:MAG: PAS domain S-box protein [Bacteroidales bacterium]|jgi:PAS domain S-box-containing protein|nr:PAS domain S-box protein [Bacteroidales bacterium]